MQTPFTTKMVGGLARTFVPFGTLVLLAACGGGGGGSGGGSGLTHGTAPTAPSNLTATYVVKAVDTSGNISAASHTASVPTPASTTPQQLAIAITSPSATGTFTSTAATLSVSGTASDSSELTTVTWADSTNNTAGTATGTTTWSIPSIALVTGTNTISITASDASGLSATAKITITYAPAAKVPSIAITAPSSSGTYSSTIQECLLLQTCSTA